ncbi:MAG: lytic transglycosylase domain-containing protein [Proteobacteria bacterium]|nr:lytic transglycosylase domain-containing protein [Pseudomonadota bacterium]
MGGFALAQSALPPGVIQNGTVITMAPISDSDSPAERGPTITSERRPSAIRVLSQQDHDLYTKAFDAAARGDWTAARALADQGHDPIARRLIQWRYLLDKNSGAAFAEISAFLRANPDWPSRDTLFARAERAMDPAMDPHAVVSWFGDREPTTGMGRVRLGEALVATGSITKGNEYIRQGWITGSFEPADELMIAQRHGSLLTPEVDRQRLDQLLWANDLAGARREISRVTADVQRVGQTRIALQSGAGAGLKMFENLPGASRNDPGLTFDRARALRRQGRVDEVPPVIESAPVREIAKAGATKWWAEVNLAVRQAIKDSNYRSAYWMASRTGLTEGQEYAEAQFLAGWIALTYLKDAKTALTHFENLEKGVTRPISKSRALYWQGRAEEASGDQASAYQDYHSASAYPDTFYGQLALAKVDATPHMHLREAVADTASVKADFDKDDEVRAVRVLADVGIVSLVRTFALDSAEKHPDAGHIKLLGEMLVQSGFREVAVRIAKGASYEGVLIAAYSHPMIALPAYTGPAPAPEPAFVYGIIRQETEFDPTAVSGAGAVGLMQLMPSTARHSANYAGLPYRPNDLVSDPTYNMQLGMAELSGDLADWGRSLVLTSAAYNAGPNNAAKWVAANGDPRSPTVDPIDWIELIPFSETRNYVQRVIENTNVYRSRITGRDEPLRILSDVYGANAANMKPLQYVPPATEPGETVPTPKPRPRHGREETVAP